MTYEESSALMQDMTFTGRVKVAALKYADYILNEANNIPAHNTRIKWAAETFRQPQMAANQLVSPVVMDGGVQQAGADVTDAILQSAVESVVNKML
ncbi:MAG TPA: hypothetical protein VF077_09395 [Nitrospiraceae bacterium]